jgi:hypothetical protein
MQGEQAAMTLRADHVAGAFFILLGVAVFIIGDDLPFGRLSAPGAGMMPKLVAGLMMLFAVIIIAGAGSGRPLAAIGWDEVGHAVQVVLITAAAVALYTRLGFLITMTLLIFVLLVVIERRHVVPAALYSIGLTLFAYWLFGKALRAPLERGLLWF